MRTVKRTFSEKKGLWLEVDKLEEN